MANPYLPNWEYIPDGEPRVFGDRVYIYGSHDTVGGVEFCDYQLKVWSAPVSNPGNWTCHGVAFATKDINGHPVDTDWTSAQLYAPDVVQKDGRYYLYAYIVGAKGCVAVSDTPEGPFTLIGQYEYEEDPANPGLYDYGSFIDPGVLVDDDGRVYIYCGFLGSYMAEIDGKQMNRVIPGTYKKDIIPAGDEEWMFFEACSLRKVGDTYYLIYSPKKGCRLEYATAASPTGPFVHRGTIIDNELEYPGGNDHGSICKINDQWYIFYHRMTNGTIMSRRGCVERIEILPDGTIPQVEMTSLGFAESLNPFEITPGEIACALMGGATIAERDLFTRTIVNIKEDAIIGWKYFDFGGPCNSATKLALKLRGCGCIGKFHVLLDSADGEEIGCIEFGVGDGVYKGEIKAPTGRHAIYLKAEGIYKDWIKDMMGARALCELESIVFLR